MQWYKKKMNVKLGAQLMSESVACSLQYCLEEKLPGFVGCEATIKFIRTFNRLFDVLNSRNLKAFAFNKPLQPSNADSMIDFILQTKQYIASPKESKNGKLMLNSDRKTGF